MDAQVAATLAAACGSYALYSLNTAYGNSALAVKSQCSGIMILSSTTTISPQAAQRITPDAGNPAKMLAGSYFRATKIA